MKTENLVLKIGVDTTEFDRAMKRTGRKLWWYQHGYTITLIIHTLAAVTIGFLLGTNV
jgi:hypothetical protein